LSFFWILIAVAIAVVMAMKKKFAKKIFIAITTAIKTATGTYKNFQKFIFFSKSVCRARMLAQTKMCDSFPVYCKEINLFRIPRTLHGFAHRVYPSQTDNGKIHFFEVEVAVLIAVVMAMKIFFCKFFFSSPSRSRPRSRPGLIKIFIFFKISGAATYVEKREKLKMCEIPRINKK
jgi:hypothetical protein